MRIKQTVTITVFFLTGLTTALLLSFLPFSSFAQQKAFNNLEAKPNIPTAIQSCLPKGDEYSFLVLEASTQYQSKDYYLISSQVESPSIFTDDPEPFVEKQKFLIEKDDIGCLIKQTGEQSQTLSMTLFVPEPVANQLALGSLQNDVQEAGGKEAYLQKLESMPADVGTSKNWYFFPEQAWAYSQLGMKLPQPAVITVDFEQIEEK